MLLGAVGCRCTLAGGRAGFSAEGGPVFAGEDFHKPSYANNFGKGEHAQKATIGNRLSAPYLCPKNGSRQTLGAMALDYPNTLVAYYNSIL